MNSKNLNKALAIALCASAMIPGIVSAKAFKDVKPTGDYAWAFEYINTLSDEGIINGYPDDYYKPANPVSLEEVFKLLNGIINPTRQEISESLSKYGSICDKNGVAGWAKESFAVALNRNIITESTLERAKADKLIGSSNNKYPDRNTIAVYFAKGLKLDANGDESLLHHSDKNIIPQVTRGYLASLVKAGIFAPTGSDGKFEGNRNIRRAEMAKITKLSRDYANTVGIENEQSIEGKVILTTKLNDINTIITEKDNKTSQFKVNNSTIYKMGDKTVKFDDVKEGQIIKVTYVKNGDNSITGIAKKVEIIKSETEYYGFVTDTNSDNFTVKYRNAEKDFDFSKIDEMKTTDKAKFELAKDVDIYRYGDKIKIKDLKEEDFIQFKTNPEGKVIEANVIPKTYEIKGEIKEIKEPTDKMRETITLKLDNGKKFTFFGSKDRDKSNPFFNSYMFTGLREGKDVTLQLRYENVVQVGEKGQEMYLVGDVSDVRTYDNSRNPADIWIRTNSGTSERLHITDKTEFKDNTSDAKRPNQTFSDLKGMVARVEIKGNDVIKFTRINKKDAIDAIAQIVKVEDKSSKYKYTVKILDVNYGDASKKDEFDFETSSDFSKYQVLRITGLKDGDDLKDITITTIEKTNGELSSYNYDYNKNESKNNSSTIKWN